MFVTRSSWLASLAWVKRLFWNRLKAIDSTRTLSLQSASTLSASSIVSKTPSLNYNFGKIKYNINLITKMNDIVNLWIVSRDTAGQERYHTLTRGHFRKTKAIVLVYDITSKESFEKLKYWIECINEVCLQKCQNKIFLNTKFIYPYLEQKQMQLFSESIFMIGNKLDLNKEREVPYEHAKRVKSLKTILSLHCVV